MVMTGPGLASRQPWTAPIPQATGFSLRLSRLPVSIRCHPSYRCQGACPSARSRPKKSRRPAPDFTMRSSRSAALASPLKRATRGGLA
jgi:hypothetical protein